MTTRFAAGAALAVAAVVGPFAQSRPELPLVQPSHIQYEGKFFLPDDRGFDYLTHVAVAFNPGRKSLFVSAWDVETSSHGSAEVTIPEIDGRAEFVQPVTPSLEGKIALVGPDGRNGRSFGGHYVYKDKLYINVFLYYANSSATKGTLFSRPLDLSVTGQVSDPVPIGRLLPDYTSGYMGDVPAEWQEALGGPAVAGNCCLSIKSRTSYGPALFVFDPENPRAARPLVYYPQSDQTLGAYGVPGPNPVFNGVTRVTGIVLVPGTSTALFIGSTGLGKWSYSGGTDHAPPEVGYAWAYDLRDLADVRRGRKRPWQPVPYWHGELPEFGQTIHDFGTGGAAFDPETRRMYVAKPRGERIRPAIYVYSVPPLN